MLHILRHSVAGMAHSFRCSAFPVCTRFAGLQTGSQKGAKAFLFILLALCNRQFIAAIIKLILRMAFDPVIAEGVDLRQAE